MSKCGRRTHSKCAHRTLQNCQTLKGSKYETWTSEVQPPQPAEYAVSPGSNKREIKIYYLTNLLGRRIYSQILYI